MASPGNNNNFSINNETYANTSYANASFVKKVNVRGRKLFFIYIHLKFYNTS